MKSIVSFLVIIFLGVCVLASPHGDTHVQIAEISEQLKEDPENAFLYFQRANLYLDHGDLDSALIDYNRSLKHDGEIHLVHLQRSIVYFKQNLLQVALVEVNKFLSSSNEMLEKGHLQRARIYRQNNSFELAIVDYQKALSSSSPELPQIYLELADSYMHAPDNGYKKAIYTLEKGIKRLGAIQSFQFKIIELYRERELHTEALNYIDNILTSVTRTERWLVLKGDIYSDLKEFEQAEFCYKAALTEINKLSYSRKNTETVEELSKSINEKLNQLPK